MWFYLELSRYEARSKKSNNEYTAAGVFASHPYVYAWGVFLAASCFTLLRYSGGFLDSNTNASCWAGLFRLGLVSKSCIAAHIEACKLRWMHYHILAQFEYLAVLASLWCLAASRCLHSRYPSTPSLGIAISITTKRHLNQPYQRGRRLGGTAVAWTCT